MQLIFDTMPGKVRLGDLHPDTFFVADPKDLAMRGESPILCLMVVYRHYGTTEKSERGIITLNGQMPGFVNRLVSFKCNEIFVHKVEVTSVCLKYLPLLRE